MIWGTVVQYHEMDEYDGTDLIVMTFQRDSYRGDVPRNMRLEFMKGRSRQAQCRRVRALTICFIRLFETLTPKYGMDAVYLPTYLVCE